MEGYFKKEKEAGKIVAEPLKNYFGEIIPFTIAEMISSVYPKFDQESFITLALDGYEPLNLMARGRKIAHSLHHFLPDNFEEAISILIESLDTRTNKSRNSGPIDSFLFLPHTYFVAFYGLSHFEVSMRAQYVLTQRFTAEFSIRPFLENHTQATLNRLAEWSSDPNVHVRRLVSEGTRPRLPWASRLKKFQDDPQPVLDLLEHLKDDPEEYVRRSVANNLNDIGKDNLSILFSTTRRWMKNASPYRRKLIRHALRSAVKKGDPDALTILGFNLNPQVLIKNISITPKHPEAGQSVKISFTLESTHSHSQQLMVDFRIHYVKANGRTTPKVFKLKTLELAPYDQNQLCKTVSLAEMTTRKHYPGEHKIDVLINGNVRPLGSFKLMK